MIIEIAEDGLNHVLRETHGVLNEALKMKKGRDKNKRISEAIGYIRAAYLMVDCYEPVKENPEDSAQG